MPASNDDRNAEIYDLATVQGLPHAEIADRYGISRQRVGKIVSSREASAERTRDEHRAELRKQYRRLQKTIDNPQPQHTATGHAMANVLTCTCGSKSDRMDGHPEGCKVEPVTNESVIIAALKEQRLILESVRKMEAANLAARDDSQTLREVESYITGLEREVSALRSRNDALAWEVRALRERLGNGRVHISTERLSGN